MNEILLVEDNPDDVALTLRAFSKSNIANTIVVAAVRGDERVAALPRQITLKTVPPALTITRPADGDTVEAPSLVIEGRSESGSSVTVNGHATNVTPEGAFSDTLQVTAGPLTVDVVARDQAGNETKKTLTLTVKASAAAALRVVVTLDRATARPGQSVSVTVVVSDSGQPIDDATIVLSVGIGTAATGRTDASGRYRAIVAAPSQEGIVQVVAIATGSRGTGRAAASLEVVKN